MYRILCIHVFYWHVMDFIFRICILSILKKGKILLEYIAYLLYVLIAKCSTTMEYTYKGREQGSLIVLLFFSCQSEVSGSFHPFEIVQTEGSSSGLMLRRNLRDEEIIVTCVLEIEEPDDAEYLLEDNEDELKLIQHLSMNVQIKKAAQGDEARFLIVCHYVDQSVTIEDVMCIGKSEYIQSDHPYSGPVFS